MESVGSRLAAGARVTGGLLALGVAAGVLAITDGPAGSTTYAGRSSFGLALTLAAGLSLVGAALVTSLGRGATRMTDLALLAGLLWFAPAWIAWQEGPPLVRSLATVLGAFTVPLVFHLALTSPGGRTSSAPARALVAVVYVETLLAAVGFALFRDPYLDPGCWANCTVNNFLVSSLPSFTHALEIADRWFLATAAVAFIALSVARVARASRPALRRLLPVAVPAIVFAGTVIARAIALQRVTVEDPFDAFLFAIFVVESVALVLLASGLIWAVLRSQVERRAVARVVADLDEAPAPGSLQSALAEALGDPGLRVAYWLPDRRCYVDASGREVPEPAATPGRALTRLVRNERTLAIVAHAGAARELEGQLGPAVRLALENERLQAEVLAQLEELRASRTRIVETADAERRRLERDLHDGAQQRLLALSYDVRLARASAEADGDTSTEIVLARAIDETQGALEVLRELAHGIFPAVLTEAGLGAALATLADTAPLPVEILRAEDRRYPDPVETAAYLTVAEAVADAARRNADRASVTVDHDDGRLVVTIEDDGSGPKSPMVTLTDRVGALGGLVEAGPSMLRAEIPCA